MHPAQTNLVSLFDDAVRQWADNPALIDAAGSMSYRELDDLTSRLAAHLVTLGVGQESIVCVMLPRSRDLYISLLAILKAGAAYLPLDLAHPATRVAHLLSESDPAAILTHRSFESRFPAGSVSVFVDEQDLSQLPQVATGALPLPGPMDAAYLLYTSGSTGLPKGVVNEHRGICNRLQWHIDLLDITAADRIPQKTPYTFDISVWEIFATFAVGAGLVIVPPDKHVDAEYIGEMIDQQALTVMHFVPSLLDHFLSANTSLEKPALRHVVCSGEALSVELERRFFERFPGVALHNMYGPTEAAIDVSHWRCHSEPSATFVPIGFPAPNNQLYVLAPDRALLADGERGELAIGGIQVGRGYLKQPELSAKSFIDNPFAPGRLYLTGDIASRLPDGAYAYHGRLDHQVKLRGLRIELGEIEHALEAHSDVRRAIVTLEQAGEVAAELVAFVQPTIANAQPSRLVLRKHLATVLPDHMIPHHMHAVEEFPLTSNGKLDRATLSSMRRPVARQEMREPETAAELELAMLVRPYIDTVSAIDMNCSFFDLGGHSLTAMELIKALESACGESVELQTLALSNLGQVAASLSFKQAPGAKRPSFWQRLIRRARH